MRRSRLSKAAARILEQCWKLGTCSVREILDSLPQDEQVAYTTVQTLEQKGALRRVKKISNAQLFSRRSTSGSTAAAWYTTCSTCSASRRVWSSPI
jgi:predicted transcriptional regulator